MKKSFIFYFLIACLGFRTDSVSEQPVICEISKVEIPVMAHLAVAMDGTVLLFREEREKKRIEVKRSKDGGVSWSEFEAVGKRIKIADDMSDDGRYKGEHVGWTELANVVINENNGDVMVFAACLKSCLLYTSPSPRDRTRSRMPSSA